jgi:drug/metabolite transporter (DMT)-like permease
MGMNWFFLALGCAFCTACCDSISKRVMRTNDEWITGTVILGIAIVFLIPVWLSQHHRPLSLDLVLLLAVALPMEVFAYYLFLSAIRMSPLSLTVPLLAFTPVMTILSAAALLDEHVSRQSVLGISLVTVGAYLLHGDLIHHSLLAPIRALFSEAGSRRMVLVACIWSITSALGKKGVWLFGAIPFGIVLLGGVLACFALVSLFRLRDPEVKIDMSKGALFWFVVAGIIMAAAEITHFLSLSMAPVAYMISVKRLSLVFGVILGWLWFREHNIRSRLLGATIMVAGVFFLC